MELGALEVVRKDLCVHGGALADDHGSYEHHGPVQRRNPGTEAARELRLLLALQEHNLVVVVIYHAADVGMISVGTPAQDHDPQDVLSVRAFCSPSCSPQ